MAAPSVLAALLLAALLASGAHAGCYKRSGLHRPPRTAAELYMNHSPAPRLRLEDMPAEFQWCARRRAAPRGQREQRLHANHGTSGHPRGWLRRPELTHVRPGAPTPFPHPPIPPPPGTTSRASTT